MIRIHKYTKKNEIKDALKIIHSHKLHLAHWASYILDLCRNPTDYRINIIAIAFDTETKKAVGCCIISRIQSAYPEGYNINIFVSTRYRRRGIGKRLLNKVRKETTLKSPLEYFTFSKENRRFYEKFEFCKAKHSSYTKLYPM